MRQRIDMRKKLMMVLVLGKINEKELRLEWIWVGSQEKIRRMNGLDSEPHWSHLKGTKLRSEILRMSVIHVWLLWVYSHSRWKVVSGKVVRVLHDVYYIGLPYFRSPSVIRCLQKPDAPIVIDIFPSFMDIPALHMATYPRNIWTHKDQQLPPHHGSERIFASSQPDSLGPSSGTWGLAFRNMLHTISCLSAADYAIAKEDEGESTRMLEDSYVESLKGFPVVVYRATEQYGLVIFIPLLWPIYAMQLNSPDPQWYYRAFTDMKVLRISQNPFQCFKMVIRWAVYDHG